MDRGGRPRCGHRRASRGGRVVGWRALSTDNFGKLLDRLLVFRKVNVPFWRQLLPLAEQLLDDLKGRRLALIERAQGGPRSLQR